jgi:hypothetical protein
VDNALAAADEARIPADVTVQIDQLAEDRVRVICTDNGPGIVAKNVPMVFGKLLFGSKFHRLKMSRGQQGIGVSAAGMYGLLTTGHPVRVISRTSARGPALRFEIQIDTQKNQPTVRQKEEVAWDLPHGTSVEIELEASYRKGQHSVAGDLRQFSRATPGAAVGGLAAGGVSRGAPGGLVKPGVRRLPPRAARDEQSGALAQLLDQPRRSDIRVAPQLHHTVDQILFGNIGGTGQLGLLFMHFESQPVEQAANFLPVDTQPFRQALMLHFDLAFGVAHNFRAFPPVQQQVDGIGIQLLAFFGQAAAAPGVQAGHQGEQQRPFCQTLQAVAGGNRALELRGASLGIFFIDVAQNSDVPIPVFDEEVDLAGGKGRKRGFGKIGQAPVLFLVGVDAAGDQHAAILEGGEKIFDYLFELLASPVGFGHFIQAIQQNQAAFFEQFFSQKGGVIADAGVFELGSNKTPEVVGARLFTTGGQAACGKIAQDDAHRQERAVLPGLRLRFFVIIFLFGQGRGQAG